MLPYKKYSTEASLIYLGMGTVFFITSYFISRQIFTKLGRKTFSKADLACLSCKFVSSIQGIMAVVAGWLIVDACHKDIMHDQHWLSDTYTWFAMPYFYYDIVAEYTEHCYKHPEISHRHIMARWGNFVRHNKLLFMHHVTLPIIFFPTILFLRKGLGDYFVGVFFLIELAIPFIAFRNVLVQLQMKNTMLYVVSGLMMIVVFIFSRILVFPFLFWKYAQYASLNPWHVPLAIPTKCTVGCLSIFFIQFYWLTKMFKGVKKLILRHPIESRKKE